MEENKTKKINKRGKWGKREREAWTKKNEEEIL